MSDESVPPCRPPADLAELEVRAAALAGGALSELQARSAVRFSASMVRRKGKAGQLVERLLGASAGSLAVPDFPELGVELKTLPIDAQGRPTESTFVCTLSLADADRMEWSDSPVRAKLAHVLWVPILVGDEPRIGTPFFWKPTAEQEDVLKGDFEEIVGMVAIGNVEGLTAHVGRWLQARPKAAHGGVRTRAYGADDEPLSILPRGFYLRARFTRELLRERRRLW